MASRKTNYVKDNQVDQSGQQLGLDFFRNFFRSVPLSHFCYLLVLYSSKPTATRKIEGHGSRNCLNFADADCIAKGSEASLLPCDAIISCKRMGSRAKTQLATIFWWLLPWSGLLAFSKAVGMSIWHRGHVLACRSHSRQHYVYQKGIHPITIVVGNGTAGYLLIRVGIPLEMDLHDIVPKDVQNKL
jgi:hypothetical protein